MCVCVCVCVCVSHPGEERYETDSMQARVAEVFTQIRTNNPKWQVYMNIYITTNTIESLLFILSLLFL